MRPCWIHLLLLVNTSFSESQACLLDVGKWSEYVFFNHLHHFVQIRNDQARDILLVLQHLLEFLDSI